MTSEDSLEYLTEGVFINGLFLEGADMDNLEGGLIDPRPKELFSNLPIIKLIPHTN